MKFKQAVNQAFKDAIAQDSRVLVLGQLAHYGQAGDITRDLPPDNLFTTPCAEQLQNSMIIGLALAGYRPVMIHERFEFLQLGSSPLLDFIPCWPPLPVVLVAVVGKGGGQGPQQSKDYTSFWKGVKGWTVVTPDSPEAAHQGLLGAILGASPAMVVLHRELFELETQKTPYARQGVEGCGASARHEAEFYG